MMKDGTQSMADKRDYTVTAADRALRVLEVLAEHPNIGVTEIARHMKATKSLVFRLLQTLEAREFVDKNIDRSTYTLGYRMMYFGRRAEQQNSLVTTASPILDDLCARADENINLVIRDNLNSLCVATRDSRHHMRLFAEAGRRGPLHAGGASTLICAYAPQEIHQLILADKLQAFTSETMVDPEQLRSRWQQIRKDGFYVVYGDLDEGAYSIAAPIRDHFGEVVAAVSIAGPISRLDESRRQNHLINVIEAAKSISARLGYYEMGDQLTIA
jgi:IclR family KDG regulon transcriptional repressor